MAEPTCCSPVVHLASKVSRICFEDVRKLSQYCTEEVNEFTTIAFSEFLEDGWDVTWLGQCSCLCPAIDLPGAGSTRPTSLQYHSRGA